MLFNRTVGCILYVCVTAVTNEVETAEQLIPDSRVVRVPRPPDNIIITTHETQYLCFTIFIIRTYIYFLFLYKHTRKRVGRVTGCVHYEVVMYTMSTAI